MKRGTFAGVGAIRQTCWSGRDTPDLLEMTSSRCWQVRPHLLRAAVRAPLLSLLHTHYPLMFQRKEGPTSSSLGACRCFWVLLGSGCGWGMGGGWRIASSE
jgi:hypothetical protein